MDKDLGIDYSLFFYKYVTCVCYVFVFNSFHQIATAKWNGVYVRRGRSIARTMTITMLALQGSCRSWSQLMV
jgi:hypothetical protein